LRHGGRPGRRGIDGIGFRVPDLEKTHQQRAAAARPG
jgi:hypothetical protein